MFPIESVSSGRGGAVANVEYLGDDVYAEWVGDMVKLMTGSHLAPDNTIFLDPHVYDALVAFVMLPRNTTKSLEY